MNELLQVFLISMVPVFEIKASIPMGIVLFNLPVWQVFVVSFLGNTLICMFLLAFLEVVSEFLIKHSSFFKKFITWLFERTRRKNLKKFEDYRDFALFVLVALPFPLTGTWTASLCAFLFGISFKRALFLIIIGSLVASFIIILTTLGIINI
ncbi:MAG: small multi-drug export protein [Candidatus Pacebacteria bacterium]|nr:small multi-drug export protein [Candidatus Paceibacterota bacterium]